MQPKPQIHKLSVDSEIGNLSWDSILTSNSSER